MNIVDRRPTDDRVQGSFTHFAKISNGHNSATHQPISFMFVVLGGVFGDGGSNGSISRWIKSKMAAGGNLGKFQMAISQQRMIRSTSCLVPG